MTIFLTRQFPFFLPTLILFLLIGVVLLPYGGAMASTEKPETAKEELKAPEKTGPPTKGQPKKEDEIQKKIDDLKKELKNILNDERLRKKIRESAEGLALLLEIVMGVLLDELEQGVEKLKKNKEAYLEEIRKKIDLAKEILKKEIGKTEDSKQKTEDGKKAEGTRDEGTKDEKTEDVKQKTEDGKKAEGTRDEGTKDEKTENGKQ